MTNLSKKLLAKLYEDKGNVPLENIGKLTRDAIPDNLFYFSKRVIRRGHTENEYNVDVLIEEDVWTIKVINEEDDGDMIILDGAANFDVAILIAEKFCADMEQGNLDLKLALKIFLNEKKGGFSKYSFKSPRRSIKSKVYRTSDITNDENWTDRVCRHNDEFEIPDSRHDE
jgi:hypothetical protein